MLSWCTLRNSGLSIVLRYIVAANTINFHQYLLNYFLKKLKYWKTLRDWLFFRLVLQFRFSDWFRDYVSFFKEVYLTTNTLWNVYMFKTLYKRPGPINVPSIYKYFTNLFMWLCANSQFAHFSHRRNMYIWQKEVTVLSSYLPPT